MGNSFDPMWGFSLALDTTATGDQTSTMVGGYGTGIIWAVPLNAKVVKGTAIFVYEE